MTEDYQRSGDKGALSPASQPLFLCLQYVPDPEPVEPVERVLFSDREDCSFDVSDRPLPRCKRTKLRIAPSKISSRRSPKRLHNAGRTWWDKPPSWPAHPCFPFILRSV